jgi:hypothetical protein
MSLFDKLFGLEKPEKTSDETGVLLTTAHGNEELAAIEALLRSADIPYRLSDRGAGGVVRVISGYTMYGTDVYVREQDMETAQELLTPVDEQMPVDEVDENSEEEA